MRLAHWMVLALTCAAWALLSSTAPAQVVGGPMGNFPGLGFNPFGNGFAPNTGFMPGMNGFSNQQLGSMMGMRMMQGMGGYHGVQTGVANPFMNGGFGSQPDLYYEPPASNSTSSAGGKVKHSGSSSKREEARARRAEEKRLAAEAKAKPKAAKKPRPQKGQS